MKKQWQSRSTLELIVSTVNPSKSNTCFQPYFTNEDILVKNVKLTS